MTPVDYGRENHEELRTDLSHLPEDKRRELEEIVRIIRQQVAPLWVILFGSYARGDYNEEKDLAPQRWSGHASDYDLLVIVPDDTAASDASLEHAIGSACNAKPFSAHVRPIVHRLSHVNANLREGQYFFLDIKREGRRLYDSREAELEEPQDLPPADQLRIVRDYFRAWYEQAKDFYDTYEMHVDKQKLALAAFDLNQATESAYKCILLVHTLYTPQEHRLGLLGEMAAEFGPVFEEIFPQETDEQEELFRLLDNAYIAARYRMDFRVDREHLDYLSERVRQLLEVTESVCQQEIQSLEQAAVEEGRGR